MMHPAAELAAQLLERFIEITSTLSPDELDALADGRATFALVPTDPSPSST